jgi:hypothetical protein
MDDIQSRCVIVLRYAQKVTLSEVAYFFWKTCLYTKYQSSVLPQHRYVLYCCHTDKTQWMPQAVAISEVHISVLKDYTLLLYVFNTCNIFPIVIRGCIRKFPDWVDNEINNNKHSLRSNTKGYGDKNLLDWLTK